MPDWRRIPIVSKEYCSGFVARLSMIGTHTAQRRPVHGSELCRRRHDELCHGPAHRLSRASALILRRGMSRSSALTVRASRWIRSERKTGH